ncbi:aryl hydrocarbon receptor-like isoform X2 [Acipenser ruthenus]|uniref:aryl hydrocarbon receptor-like isoform X2 n=1 Tax=Acipenser ruthenus TaxID=7906 RepID=UPI0027419991|nr:aryl hydrocarbon receptor-like isoform X2 [Acipenser ruthenus]
MMNISSGNTANCIYASRKRRKPVQKSAKPSLPEAKSNPSKRHRDRLNTELERLASLLPFPQDVISKLDKLSVLRLSVSYLRAKSFFSASINSNSCKRPAGNGLHDVNKLPCDELLEGELLLQVLNGFVLVVTADGLVFYVSSTLQDYLGFNQSDVIHQSVYELIHTEDRAEFQRQLHWALNPGPPPDSGQIVPADNGLSLPVTYYNPEKLPPENSAFLERNFVCRLRCLLDNSSGFLALNFQGRLKFLHGQNTKSKDGSTIPPQLALFVVATPLQPPSILEIRTRNFIFRTKHKLDFTPTACDAKGKIVLGYTEAELCYRGTGYQFIHAADMLYCAENHIRMIKTGESGMTVFRLLTKQNRWAWVQANARLVYKNGRPDYIIATQRALSDNEGLENLRKRNLKLPFSFATGEAVLYETTFPLAMTDPMHAKAKGKVATGASSKARDQESLDPNSLLGAILKQDESIYVCAPAQNKIPFETGPFNDTKDDLNDIMSSDWQDNILPVTQNNAFREEDSEHTLDGRSNELFNFMKNLGISMDDLELIQQDEEFLKVEWDDPGDITDVADDILNYVQESLKKRSDCMFSSCTLQKPLVQSPSGTLQQQQLHPQLHPEQQQQQLYPQQPQQNPQQQQLYPQQPQQNPQQQQQLYPQQPQQNPQQQQLYPQQPQQNPQQQQQLYPQQPQQNPQQQQLYPQQPQQNPQQQQQLYPQQPQQQNPQQQLCQKMEHMQVNTPWAPVNVLPANCQQQPQLLQQQALQQYGYFGVDGTAQDFLYKTELNTVQPACTLYSMPSAVSQHHQPLNVTDMNYPVNDFNTLELEDFLESLQPCPETLKCGISPQDSMITSQTYYTGAVSMYQCLPETQSTCMNQVNQMNQMVFSPGTSQQQTFLPKFQNGYNETYPEPYSLMDCTQPKQPLHYQQSETRPNSDPSSSGSP